MFQEEILDNFMRRKYQERRRKAGMGREKGWREVDGKKREQSQSPVEAVRWNTFLQGSRFPMPVP